MFQIIHHFGFKTDSWVHALSLGTLGLTLATQFTIKNPFRSLIIVMDRPFRVGDEIISGITRGQVEEIGLRATLLHTTEDSIV